MLNKTTVISLFVLLPTLALAQRVIPDNPTVEEVAQAHEQLEAAAESTHPISQLQRNAWEAQQRAEKEFARLQEKYPNFHTDIRYVEAIHGRLIMLLQQDPKEADFGQVLTWLYEVLDWMGGISEPLPAECIHIVDHMYYFPVYPDKLVSLKDIAKYAAQEDPEHGAAKWENFYRDFDGHGN